MFIRRLKTNNGCCNKNYNLIIDIKEEYENNNDDNIILRNKVFKPNKEIFDYALNKTGANTSNSIMIGDNLDADIQGGINIGMDTVFVNHLNVAPTLPATYTITHLKELEELL